MIMWSINRFILRKHMLLQGIYKNATNGTDFKLADDQNIVLVSN